MSEAKIAISAHLGFFLIDLPFISTKLQMNRAGCAGRCDAKRLAHHVRETINRIHCGVHLGDRREGWQVIDFLVQLAEIGATIAPAGEGDHR